MSCKEAAKATNLSNKKYNKSTRQVFDKFNFNLSQNIPTPLQIMSVLGKFLKFSKKNTLLVATAGLVGFTTTLNCDTNIPMVQAKTLSCTSLENMIIFR